MIGFKGLKASAVEKDGKRTVEVKSSMDLDPETRAKIEFFAKFSGQHATMKMMRELTPEEKEKGFTPGKLNDPNSSKAPPGATWFVCLKLDLSPTGGGMVLLRDQPSVTWSEISVSAQGDGEWTFKLSAAATKRLQFELCGDQPGRTVPFAHLRIAFDKLATWDEFKVALSENKQALKEGYFKLPAATAEKVEAILRFPMPRALKPAEAKK